MRRSIVFLLTALAFLGPAGGAERFEDGLGEAASTYRERVSRAGEELNRTRERIADENAPLLARMRAAEDRIIAAQVELVRLETRKEVGAEDRRKLLLELDGLRKTTTYVSTLAHESLKSAADSLAPGEDQFIAEQLGQLQRQLDDTAEAPQAAVAMDVADCLLERTERALGGYRMPGRAMLAKTNEVVAGTFAFVGPETFFLAERGGAGAVRPREGAKFPVCFSLSGWSSGQAEAFFAGKPGTMIADASGGKALRLKETTGTAWEHIRKGGVVAFAIVGVGILAVWLMLQKIRDVARMAVDNPAAVERCLDAVAHGSEADAERAVKALRPTTRELFEVGLRNVDQPKSILEERLQATLLEQRLHFERRLPLLAVIATAAPLMGLLGTVVGMVKTFALITVFGTGNAGKLSSGISEVLVATELGLAVAIPALVAHGFLAHRIQKNLSLLERYALQFTTAVQAAQLGGEPRQESVSA